MILLEIHGVTISVFFKVCDTKVVQYSSRFVTQDLILLLCYAQITLVRMSKLQRKRCRKLNEREVVIANLWMKANTLTINAAKSSALVVTPELKLPHKNQKYYVMVFQ